MENTMDKKLSVLKEFFFWKLESAV